MKIIYSVVIIVAMAVVPAMVLSVQPEALAAHQENGKTVYYCPMHPNYKSDKPGSCPICGMDLVKKEPAAKGSQERRVKFYRNPMDPSVTSPVAMKDSMGMDYVPVYEEAAASPGGVPITADKQQLIGVKTDEVKTRHLVLPIRASGRVVLDQEFYDAQNEYVQGNLVTSKYWNAAYQKLLSLGMQEDEIAALKNRRWADQGLIAIGPSDQGRFYRTPYPGSSWVYASIFENEMPLVKTGQNVDLTVAAFPGEAFQGVVAGVAQIVDPQTRTVRVRVRVEDKEKRLRPDMFVTATLQVDLGDKLAVPVAAVLDSGKRKIVYVVTAATMFTPRDVQLGVRAGEFFEVKSGLVSGDKVVVGGNFLVDAESRLKGVLTDTEK